MSQWYEADKDDLELDGDEINVLVCDDWRGNIYVTVKVADIKELLNEKATE